MSNRQDACFRSASQAGRKVLIPFMTAGDPEPDWTVGLMHELVSGGADIIELGIPFSDPMADGPVIQASSERAVDKGVGLDQVFSWVAAFRESDNRTPVVLMGYLNPFERFGYDQLAGRAAVAGVDALLLVDCPPEEMPGLQGELDNHQVYSIRLVAPTTSEDRLQVIMPAARGFVYYVSFKGTTGAGRLEADAVAGPISRIRAHTELPVAVGFGIKDADSAVLVAEHADGVVIGSALVALLAECETLDGARSCAREFLSTVRSALDQAYSGSQRA